MDTTTNNRSRRSFQTADLCDVHIASPQRLQVVQPNLFKSYGKKTSFHGKIETIRCFECNTLVRQVLDQGPSSCSWSGNSTSSYSSAADDEERKATVVLVVDGGGSQRCSLLGDILASMVKDHGWSGVVMNGYIRDSKAINEMDVGIKALGTHPLKSSKEHQHSMGSKRGIHVSFGGVEFVPGHYLYSDEDGIIVSERDLSLDNVVV
eukprot:CAMPEP_0176480120 /NCGR_PEP_ID=MMETSP0200_2-20121128/2106_1 /TAXON_ID=947934 /ORGANISM="Chaetoceros sp., Strain GSL56" /LENGTH=206 /DNA_ID=CAMNT_0017876215 /DNA_START=132 /DNA_END=752 /DNA_ORIENTATION=+